MNLKCTRTFAGDLNLTFSKLLNACSAVQGCGTFCTIFCSLTRMVKFWFIFPYHCCINDTRIRFSLGRFTDQPAAKSTGEHHWAGGLPAVVRRQPDSSHDVCGLHGRRQGHLFGKRTPSLLLFSPFAVSERKSQRKSHLCKVPLSVNLFVFNQKECAQ